MNEIETTDQYWDCECEKKYIHPKAQKMCTRCGVERDEQPDSRVNEVLALGLLIRKNELNETQRREQR